MSDWGPSNALFLQVVVDQVSGKTVLIARKRVRKS